MGPTQHHDRGDSAGVAGDEGDSTQAAGGPRLSAVWKPGPHTERSNRATRGWGAYPNRLQLPTELGDPTVASLQESCTQRQQRQQRLECRASTPTQEGRHSLWETGGLLSQPMTTPRCSTRCDGCAIRGVWQLPWARGTEPIGVVHPERSRGTTAARHQRRTTIAVRLLKRESASIFHELARDTSR